MATKIQLGNATRADSAAMRKLREYALRPIDIAPSRKNLGTRNLFDRVKLNNSHNKINRNNVPAVINFISLLENGIPPKALPTLELNQYSSEIYLLSDLAHQLGFHASLTVDSAKDTVNYFTENNTKTPLILDPFANRGLLASVLRQAGLATIATAEDGSEKDIESLSPQEALNKYGEDLTHVVLNWSTYGNYDFIRKIHENLPEVKILNIGEAYDLDYGAKDFWNHMKTVKKDVFPYVRLPFRYDSVLELEYSAEKVEQDEELALS